MPALETGVQRGENAAETWGGDSLVSWDLTQTGGSPRIDNELHNREARLPEDHVAKLIGRAQKAHSAPIQVGKYTGRPEGQGQAWKPRYES